MDSNIQRKVLRGTVVIVLVGIMAKMASFVQEAVLAACLGTTYQSDAYYMVSSIQMVIYPMLSVGIWKVYLPMYKEKITIGETEKADYLTNSVITFFTIVSVILVILLYVFSEPVVSVIAPGFKGETKVLCIRLVQLSAPMYVFILDSAIYASVLQCHNKFLGSQIREVASHIPTIIAALVFYRHFGIEVMAIALAIGGAVRLLIELPFVDWGYRFRPSFKFRTHEFNTMLCRLPSALVSEGVTQLNALIDKAMASTLPEGTVSGLNYGHKLMNVFSGLLSTAIATALYPQMVELIALEKAKELSDLVLKIINIFCLLMVPITVACILFRTELVSSVFQRGSFDESSVILTSGVFALYCMGLFFIACNTIVTDLFYAYGNTKTPMNISAVNLVINVLLNLIFIHYWGVNGLAFATSMSSFITFFIRLKLVGKYVRINWIKMLITSLKVLIATIIACMVPRVIFWVNPINQYLTLTISAVLGIVIYVMLVKAFRIEEYNDVVSLIAKRTKK